MAGTSYGAILAALYALGMPALELERLVREQNVSEIWLQGFDVGLHRGSLIYGRRLARWLDRKFFFGATFADTHIDLAVACTDLASGRLEVLREGSIARAVQASYALPGVFAPVRTGGRVLIDGGLVETVPFRALSTLGPELMVGLHAGVDVEHSCLIRRVRRFNASRRGRASNGGRPQHGDRPLRPDDPRLGHLAAVVQPGCGCPRWACWCGRTPRGVVGFPQVAPGDPCRGARHAGRAGGVSGVLRRALEGAYR